MKKQRNIRALFLFELLYKAAFLMIMYPAFSFALRMLLKITGYSYLTMENMMRFLRNPATMLVIVLLLLLGAFLYLIEAVSLIVFYQGYVKEKHIRVVQILFPGIKETLFLLRKKGRLVILLFSLMNALMTMMPMLVVFAVQLKVPAYIARSILNAPLGLTVVILFSCFCFLINFFGVYTLYYCVLEENGFLESYKKSISVITGHIWRFLGRLFFVNIIQWLGYILLYIGVLLLVCYIMYQVKDESVVLAAMFTAYDEVMIYMGVFITVSSQIVNYAVFSLYFQRYGMKLVKVNRIEKIQEQIAYEDAEWQMGYIGKSLFLKNIYNRYTRLTMLVTLLAIVINANFIYNSFRNGSLAERETLFGTYITAHRGSSAQAPENTLPALEMAIEDMADYAEIDVQETKDGVVILMHDLNLRRTTGKRAAVSSVTYAEIMELDAGAWFSEEYAGTHVPTLEEALVLCKGAINLNIELKATSNAALNADLVEKVVLLIEEYDFENQCIISSTDQSMLAKVKEWNSNLKTGYILAFAYGNFYNKDYIDFFSMKYSFVSESLVRTLHSLGKEVHTWTVNSRSEMERMIQLGVDNLITDRSVLAREVVHGEDRKLSFFKLLGIVRQ